MTSFYAQMQGVATSLLTRFEQGTLQLKRVTLGSGPDWNPGPSATTLYNLTGTVSGVDQRHVDGTLIREDDLVATVAIPEIEPTTTDKLIIDSVEHQIVKVEWLPAAGTKVALKLYARA